MRRCLTLLLRGALLLTNLAVAVPAPPALHTHAHGATPVPRVEHEACDRAGEHAHAALRIDHRECPACAKGPSWAGEIVPPSALAHAGSAEPLLADPTLTSARAPYFSRPARAPPVAARA